MIEDLLVVTGPPGAGKSTVAALLRVDAVLVTGDDFFDLLGDALVAPWLSEAHAQNEIVVEAAAGAAGRFARGGYRVVYDGVIGPWFVPTFLQAAGVGRLHYAVLLPPLEVCLSRVTSRIGHGFSDPDATRHMHRDFASASIDPRHVVSAAADPEYVAAEVRVRWAAGSLLIGQS